MRHGLPARHHHLATAWLCTPASVHGGIPPCTNPTKLSRCFGPQRGHVPPPVAAVGGNSTSPLCFVRRSVDPVSGQGGVPPCPSTTGLSLGCRGICGTRPLRPPAALLHNAAFCAVGAIRCAKAPLGVAHRCRALAGAQNRRYAKWPSLGPGATAIGAPRSLSRPRANSRRPLWRSLHCGTWSGASRNVLVSGLRPTICVCPRPPTGLAAARHWPRAGPPVRPPRGLPQPRVQAVVFCWETLRRTVCVGEYNNPQIPWRLRRHKTKKPGASPGFMLVYCALTLWVRSWVDFKKPLETRMNAR